MVTLLLDDQVSKKVLPRPILSCSNLMAVRSTSRVDGRGCLFVPVASHTTQCYRTSESLVGCSMKFSWVRVGASNAM